jgi:hypothetical protein
VGGPPPLRAQKFGAVFGVLWGGGGGGPPPRGGEGGGAPVHQIGSCRNEDRLRA